MGVLSFTDHTYYNDGWQALEVRRETAGTEDPDPREQFVWHPEYIDSLAVRYYDSDTDANLAELSDGTHYYTHDANYNVTAITTATGTVLERYQYDPYGKLTVLDANLATDADGKSDIDNATTYTGRWFDPESGRYDFRNREYDPITGRFLGRDPIGYDNGANLYAAYFVPNAVDPDGQVVWVTGGIGAVIGGVIGAGVAALSGGSWGDIGRGAVGGAVAGGVTGLTLGLGGAAISGLVGGGVGGGALAGGVAGVAGNVAQQGVGNLADWQSGFDPYNATGAGVLGAIGGGICVRASTLPQQPVTSWAPRGTPPNLAPPRWVMVGGPSAGNYVRSGTFQPWGPYGYPPGNYITGTVPGTALQYPGGWLGNIKGVIGQRICTCPNVR